ncbi:hypothetical protein ACA910_019266 [Epithemia clementina (nom. ined.)]
MAQQEDGGYPRLNGSMICSGQYNNMIVSLVGQFASAVPTGNTVEFVCCDQGRATVILDQAELPENLAALPEMYYELIGQVAEDGSLVLFVAREMSADMDMGTYNQMIQIQQNPKFMQYFGGGGGQMESAMATN